MALALAALAFAAYLVILQLFVIDATCIWCMVNDVILIPLFAVLALVRLWTAPDRWKKPGRQAEAWRRVLNLPPRREVSGNRRFQLQDPRERGNNTRCEMT